MLIHLTSFGHLHGPRPDAQILLDLRPFTDPHLDPRLRDRTAHHKSVCRAVRHTPGIRRLLRATVAQTQAYARGHHADQRTLHIAVGCAGGRHRAGVTAHLLARRLRRRGHHVHLHHRDLHRPVVNH